MSEEKSGHFEKICADCGSQFVAKSSKPTRCVYCQNKRNANKRKDWVKANGTKKKRKERYKKPAATFTEKPRKAPKVTLKEAVEICKKYGVSYGKASTMGLFNK